MFMPQVFVFAFALGISSYAMTLVVKMSAEFAWIALYGIFGGTMRFVPDDNGMLHEVTFSRKRRIKNAIAAALYPTLSAALLTLLLVWLASTL